MMAHHKILNKRGAERKYGDAYIIWSLIRARSFTLFPLFHLCVTVSLSLSLSVSGSLVVIEHQKVWSILHLILAKKSDMEKKTLCFVIMCCLEVG